MFHPKFQLVSAWLVGTALFGLVAGPADAQIIMAENFEAYTLGNNVTTAVIAPETNPRFTIDQGSGVSEVVTGNGVNTSQVLSMENTNATDLSYWIIERSFVASTDLLQGEVDFYMTEAGGRAGIIQFTSGSNLNVRAAGAEIFGSGLVTPQIRIIHGTPTGTSYSMYSTLIEYDNSDPDKLQAEKWYRMTFSFNLDETDGNQSRFGVSLYNLTDSKQMASLSNLPMTGTGFASPATSINHLLLGSYRTGALSDFHYDNLLLQVVPEPSALSLLTGAMLFAAVFRKRKSALPGHQLPKVDA